jgi:hypothetical protein
VLDEAVLPWLRREHRVDLSEVQRWILTRVIELGWTPERFLRLDENPKIINLVHNDIG